MNEQFREVKALGGAVPYLGGKRLLAKAIISKIEAVPHVCYAEPFVGAGGVFFRRKLAPKAEVINDLNRDIATFFRVLQRHYQAFLDMMKWQITTRVEFQRLVKTDPDTLTDLERAARFYYLQRICFGGKVRTRTFGVTPQERARFDITKLGPELEALHCRLSGVVIECLGFETMIEKYDRPGTLFYLDPPYFGCEKDYGIGLFSRSDFEALAKRLFRIHGKFILSLNDRPEVREIFQAFRIDAVKTVYTVGGGKQARPASEVIISMV